MLAGGAQALLDEARIQQNQPLRGMRVVITRAEGRGNKLATKLREAGAIPILYPVIAHTPPDDLLAFNEAIRNMVAGTYDWLVVTSATAVQAIHESVIRIGASHGEWRRRMHVAVIGAGTAQACIDLLGLQPHIVPEAFNAHALAGAMGDVRGQRILLPNADIARPALQAALQAAGAQVVRVIAYKTVPAGQNPIDMNQLLLAGSVDAICFTSGSTVRHFASRLSDDALRVAQRTRISCIGASTAAAAAALGFEKATVAREASDNGLIEALHMPPPPDTST
jgi:uroporphyrinogen-III synthase